MYLKIIKLFCRKGKHTWLRMEVRAPGSAVLCCVSYRALLGQFIYTRQQTERTVNYIHSIRHYSYPEYNCQLVALEPLVDTARINNAQQSNVNQQCKNKGYFNESWNQNNQCTTGQPSLRLSSHNTAMTSHFSHYTLLTCHCRKSSEIRYSKHTVGALGGVISVISFFV